jgi:TolA-binding protein
MMELGFTLASDGQPQPAQEVLLELRQAHPQYSSLDRVLYELAWTHKDLQQSDKSMEIFQELLQRFPESGFAAESNFHIGQAEYARDQFSKAITAYTAAWKGTSDSQLQEKALHKLGWSYFKQAEFSESERWFREQVTQFPEGDLQVDGLFMQAQCAAKSGRSTEAWKLYRAARSAIEGSVRPETIDEQIRTLVYLQGAQTARELKQWKEVEEWLEEIKQREGAAPFLPELLYELGYCYQNTGRPDEALQAYGQVAGRYRNETAARARFMMGEIFFAQKEYAKAIPEFQRVMFGFGGDSTDAAISDWQARSAIEAGRCAEAIAASSSDEGKQKAREMAAESYKYIVERHPKHEFAAQAKQRWDALKEGN